MRRRLLIGGAALGGLLLTSVFALWLLYGRIGEWVVREKVLPRIESRLGRPVHVGSIDVGRGRVVLKQVLVEGEVGDAKALVEIDKIVATYDYGASWSGDVIVHEVSIEGLIARPRRRADGSDNFKELIANLSGKGRADDPSKPAKKSRLGRLRPRSLRLVGASMHFRDESSGASVEATKISAIADRSEEAVITLGDLKFSAGPGPRASLGEVIVTVDLERPLQSARADVGTGEVFLWSGMALTGIAGEVRQGSNAGQLVIDLSGSYRGSSETLWHADGWLEPDRRRGQLSVKADRFTLDRIASVLQDSVVKDFDESSVDAELLIEVEDGKADFAGNLDLSGLNVHHPMLSLNVMRDISLQGELVAAFDSRARTLDLSSLSLVSRGVTYELSGQLALAGGIESDGSRRQYPRVDARAIVPTADCQSVLESIPGAFIPKLQGFQLRGPFEADIRLGVDWSDLDELTVLDGFVDLPKCKILSPNDEFDTERLTNSFEHQTLVGPEEYESVDIGLESDNYAQVFDISSYFLNAVLTQEDSRFYDHKGFIPREFKSALIRNLKAERFKFGASSITMQMVKNVFLYRDKTISRKLQELFLTWYVEKTLSKNRILEIYVNAIEYGPGIYGIVKASRIFFDKHPRDLEPVEAAFLAQLLPHPRKRYFQYCKTKLNKRTASKVARVLKNMHKRERLTDEEYEDAQEAVLEFNPEKVRDLCKKLPDW